MNRNRIAYGVLLGVGALFYAIDRSREMALIFFAVLLLPALSFAAAKYCSRHVEASVRALSPRIVKGERTSLAVTLVNKSWLLCPYVSPVYLQDRPGIRYIKPAALYTLGPGEKRELTADLLGVYRGQYEVGLSGLFVEDFLRLFRLPCRKVHPAVVQVEPAVRPVGLEKLRLFENAPDPSCLPGRAEDYSSVSEIAPYDPSSEFHKIHWKMTARMDELMVRRFDTESGVQTAVLADFSPLTETPDDAAFLEDNLTEGFASVLAVLMSAREPVDFLYSDTVPVILQRTGREGLREFLDVCASLPFTAANSAETLAEHYLRDRRRCNHLLVITANLSDGLFSRLSEAAAQGLSCSVILYESHVRSQPDPVLRKALHDSGIRLVMVGLSQRIDTVLPPFGAEG